jgi:hypothetical protein
MVVEFSIMQTLALGASANKDQNVSNQRAPPVAF